jgi:hypothetical protein
MNNYTPDNNNTFIFIDLNNLTIVNLKASIDKNNLLIDKLIDFEKNQHIYKQKYLLKDIEKKNKKIINKIKYNIYIINKCECTPALCTHKKMFKPILNNLLETYYNAVDKYELLYCEF